MKILIALCFVIYGSGALAIDIECYRKDIQDSQITARFLTYGMNPIVTLSIPTGETTVAKNGKILAKIPCRKR